MRVFTVAFFGHRHIDNVISIEEKLEKVVSTLLREKEFVEFLVGRNGEFDQIASSVIRRCKRKYRDDNSALILVLPYATAEYRNNQERFEDYYDEIEISHAASKAHPKAAIQIRNREMVDRADLVICCAEHKTGGAYQALQYARTQAIACINLAQGKAIVEVEFQKGRGENII